jgi:predicted outer membrane repeat protein
MNATFLKNPTRGFRSRCLPQPHDTAFLIIEIVIIIIDELNPCIIIELQYCYLERAISCWLAEFIYKIFGGGVMKRALSVLIFLISFSHLYSLSWASHIQVCGDVSGVWDVDTVFVTCDIALPDADTLIIQAGTIVLFQAYFRFNIGYNAVLIARGTSTDPILFDERFAGNGWHGIRMLGSSDSSRFEHCTFRHGVALGNEQDLFGGGINLFNSSPAFLSCTFDSCVTPVWTGLGGGIYCADNSNPIIADCLFQYCSGNNGGAIYAKNSNPIIMHTSFTRNGAWNGGAISLDSSTAIIDSNLFLTNGAGNSGSGVSCANYSNPDIRYNIFDSCSTSNGIFVPPGGSIFANQSSTPVIRGNQITNSAGNDLYANYSGIVIQDCSPNIRENIISGNIGPAIQLTNSRSLIINNTILNNRASGILISGGSPRIIKNVIQTNSSTSYGGGIYAENCSLKVKLNLITNNSAGSGAGICIVNVVSDSIYNNTIVNNTATGQGGAIYCSASNPIIQNCILYGNIAQGMSQIHPANGSAPIVMYCDVQGGWFGEGDIDLPPLFRDLANNNYHLQSLAEPNCLGPMDSPCIDAGNPLVADDTLSCDEGLGTARSDLGAYGGGAIPTSINDNSLLPGNYFAVRNYPNPFNSSTVIEFTIPFDADVKVKVYDILGKEVTAFSPGKMHSGRQEVIWEAADFVSGIYFCKIIAGDLTSVQKMLLIK